MAKMMQSRTNRVRQPRGMRVAQATKLCRNRYMTSPPNTHQIRIKPTPILMMARWSGSASLERMKIATAVVEITPQEAIRIRRKRTRVSLVRSRNLK